MCDTVHAGSAQGGSIVAWQRDPYRRGSAVPAGSTQVTWRVWHASSAGPLQLKGWSLDGPVLDVRGNCSTSCHSCVTLCMAWVHGFCAGSLRVQEAVYIVCVAERVYIRVLFSCVVYDTRVHSIRKRCGSIVWRSTRVVEEARDRV